MRIGLLVDQYHRSTGVGVYTRSLVRELVRAGGPHEYVAIFPDREQCAAIAREHPGLSTCALPRRALLYPLWHAAAWPPVEAFTGSLDLLHVLSGSVTTPTRCPLLVTVTDLASERRPEDYPWRRRWFKRSMLDRLGEQRAHVLAISEMTASDVAELTPVPREHIHVVYCGLDRQLFEPASPAEQDRVRRRYSLPERFILFLGAISPRKNVPVLLSAFDKLVHSGTAVDLVLAGPPEGWGDQTAGQNRLSASALSRVHRAGYIDESDLPALYSAAEVFVYPSKYEGFGMPMIEAMACGTPVVAANATCLPEIAADAALYFEANSSDDLAARLSALIHDPKAREALVHKGRARAQRFDWSRIAREVISLYEGLAGRTA